MNHSPENSSFDHANDAARTEHDEDVQFETITPALSVGNERLHDAFNPDRVRKLLAAFTLISREVNLYPPQGAADKAVELHDQFENITRADTRVVVMTDKEGNVLSAANVVESADMASDTIDTFATDPAYRGKGYGSALLGEIERAAVARNKKEVRLESVYDAQEWYEKRGYERTGSGTSYSHNPTYVKHLDK